MSDVPGAMKISGVVRPIRIELRARGDSVFESGIGLRPPKRRAKHGGACATRREGRHALTYDRWVFVWESGGIDRDALQSRDPAPGEDDGLPARARSVAAQARALAERAAYPHYRTYVLFVSSVLAAQESDQDPHSHWFRKKAGRWARGRHDERCDDTPHSVLYSEQGFRATTAMNGGAMDTSDTGTASDVSSRDSTARKAHCFAHCYWDIARRGFGPYTGDTLAKTLRTYA